MSEKKEIVLVTGGSGFLGQHIIKHLIQEKESLGIKEIRSVDIVPYKNVIGHPETQDLITFVGDISKTETVEKAFIGVDCVFHCAALVSIEYPPDYKELERVNYIGTTKVLDLCLKHNVSRLIYTSCASVNFVPYMGHSTFSLVVNQTESKADTPVYNTQKPVMEFDKQFFIRGYSSTKLRAENFVLSSNGTTLNNGKGFLQTVAIRPPLMFGEGDNHFMPAVLSYLSRHKNQIPKLAGSGGKHQLAYAGNVAWGHICAYKTMKTSPKNIAGLPAFITDDTPVYDISRIIQKIADETKSMKFTLSWFRIPHFLFFFVAFLIETAVRLLNPVFKTKLNYSLRSISAFTSSVIMYNRLRASIHLDYEPIYDEKKSLTASALWYEKWANENLRAKGRGGGK